MTSPKEQSRGPLQPKSNEQRWFDLPFAEAPSEEERKLPRQSNEDGDGGVQGNDPFSSLAPGAPFIGGKATAPLIFYESNPSLKLEASDSKFSDDDRFQELLQALRRQEEQVAETRRALKSSYPNFNSLGGNEPELETNKHTDTQISELESELERKRLEIQELQEDKRSLAEVTNSLRKEVEDCKTRLEQEERESNEKLERIDLLEADNGLLRQEREELCLIIKRITANKISLAESTASELERLRRMLP